MSKQQPVPKFSKQKLPISITIDNVDNMNLLRNEPKPPDFKLAHTSNGAQDRQMDK